MKLLLTLLLVALAPGVAAADEPVERSTAPGASAPDDHPHGRRRIIRQMLLDRFDADGDGQLDRRERHRAAHALRKMARRLDGNRNPQLDRRGMRRFIERYDRNGDGQVGPREVPPGAAQRLRRFDRNRDGWVDERELPRSRRD